MSIRAKTMAWLIRDQKVLGSIITFARPAPLRTMTLALTAPVMRGPVAACIRSALKSRVPSIARSLASPTRRGGHGHGATTGGGRRFGHGSFTARAVADPTDAVIRDVQERLGVTLSEEPTMPTPPPAATPACPAFKFLPGGSGRSP